MEITGNIKNYDWGKVGSRSTVAELALKNDASFVISEKETYSELWMGDHPSGSSVVKTTKENLGDFISKDTQGNIGELPKLPFLFKVLSIRKALSIQVHPNKEEAEKLHAKFPDIYKDPNHKPELAIALTEFQAMCGFRPHEEIYQLLTEWEELKTLIGVQNIDKLNSKTDEALKECYSILMRSEPTKLESCMESMKAKILSSEIKETELGELFLTLHQDFPNDVGVLSIYFLNVLTLQPGQAIYLSANVPHAYLQGDCIECMACSDNVVRAGLTPKFKDVDTLLAMLNYKAEPASKKLFVPVKLDDSQKYTETFLPDVKDFAVSKICVPKTENSYTITNRPHGCIILVISGAAELLQNNVKLSRGKIIFVPANFGSTLNIKICEGAEDFVAFQAMYNDF